MLQIFFYFDNYFFKLTFLGTVILFLQVTHGCVMHNSANIKYTTPEKSFLDGNILLNYYEEGKGRPLLFLHGFGASSYSWNKIVIYYRNNYRSISIDLKGFGLSDRPLDTGYDILSQASHVANFILKNDLNDITVIGHSLGGGIALAVYINLKIKGESRRISSLILIDPACYPQPLPSFINIFTVPILSTISSILPSTLRTKIVLNKVYYDKSMITRETLDTYAFYLDMDGSYGAMQKTAYCLDIASGSELVRSYGSIHCPVAILWGDHDIIVPPMFGERLLRDIPRSKLYAVEGCGHAPQEECPNQTIEIINSFLEKQND